MKSKYIKVFSFLACFLMTLIIGLFINNQIVNAADVTATNIGAKMILESSEDNSNQIFSGSTLTFNYYVEKIDTDSLNGYGLYDSSAIFVVVDQDGNNLASSITSVSFKAVERNTVPYIYGCPDTKGAWNISYGSGDPDNDSSKLDSGNKLEIGTITVKVGEISSSVSSVSFYIRENKATLITYCSLTDSAATIKYSKQYVDLTETKKTFSVGTPSSDPSISIKVNNNTPSGTSPNYSYNLDKSTTKASVVLAPTDGASITSITSTDGKSYSGTSFDVNLLTGGNVTLTINTKAKDGVHIGTYTLSITRDKSSTCTLKSLTFSKGSLYNEANSSQTTFSANTLKYTLRVSESVTSFDMTPTVTDSTSLIKVNGTSLTSGTKYNISNGVSTINVVVTAQDNTTKTYTVSITRLSSDTSATISVTDLDGNSITLDSDNKATVPYNCTGYLLTVTPTNSKATGGVTNKQYNFTSNLEETKTAQVTITAEDGQIKTYTVSITKEAAETGANLKSLVVNGITTTLGEEINIVSSSLEGQTPSITYTNSLGATVTSTVDSISSYNHGKNTFTIKVKSQDGVTENTYTVNVYCASSDSSLRTIKFFIDGKEITYSNNDTTYTIQASSNSDKLTNITLELNELNSTSTFDKTLPYTLELGDNIIKLTVKSEAATLGAPDCSSTYTIMVIKPSESSGDDSNGSDSGNDGTGSGSGSNSGNGGSGDNSGSGSGSGNGGSGDNTGNGSNGNGSGDSSGNNGSNNGSNNGTSGNGNGSTTTPTPTPTTSTNSGTTSGNTSNSSSSSNTLLWIIIIALGIAVVILTISLLAVNSLKKNKFEDKMEKR